MANNTIFDDVFQTIKEKMPELMIPLINEVFGTEYQLDTPVMRGENEHHTINGKLITDSYLLIGSYSYHLECQSTEDNSMVLRMVEYDFAIGLENVQKVKGGYRLYFPHSCVLYLRGDKVQENWNLEIVFPDGQTVNYKVPVIKMEWYSLKEIFEKNLIMLLPFYIIRYEKLKNRLEEDIAQQQEMFMEYCSIERKLEKTFLENGQEKIFRDMIELIKRVTDYVFSKSEKIRKGIGEIMGGKVLELESDKLIKQGEQIGLERGLEYGLERGLEQGSFEKLVELVIRRMKKGDTPECVAEFLEEDPVLIQKIYHVVQKSGIDSKISEICKNVLEKK